MVLSARDVVVGDVHQAVVVDNLTRTQIVQYAGASGDYNPLLTDEVFATKVAGYPTVFAHGMLTMGMTGRMITDWVGDGRLTSFGVRFSRQVWPGDTLTARPRWRRSGWRTANISSTSRSPPATRTARRSSAALRLLASTPDRAARRARDRGFARRRP
jgi:acyl dehydratase